MVSLKQLNLCYCLIIALFSISICAAQTTTNKIEFIKSNNSTNEIPYFDHRFHLDAQLKEITLLFYRKTGSVSVILIRPDGSKLRISDHDKKKVAWYDGASYDMIKIKKPMPGPWQAVGDILPKSQILVVSDVKIKVPPLPKVLLAGETLKVEGKLFNGKVAISNSRFRNVVQLDVEFISTNNTNYDNFGANTIALTSFRDDGRDLDEYAGDGIFTGEFKLTIPPGEWVPLYRIKLPMLTRELRQQPIILHKNPITISVDKGKNENEFHTIHFIIDPTFVDPNSFVFQGKITYPDHQNESFSISEGKGTERIKKFAYTEPGIHRINVSAFGRTINGREFRLVVPEFSFNADLTEKELLKKVSKTNAVSDTKKNKVHTIMPSKPAPMSETKKILSSKNTSIQWIIIGIVNLIIIIIGLIVFFVIQKRNRKK